MTPSESFAIRRALSRLPPAERDAAIAILRTDPGSEDVALDAAIDAFRHDHPEEAAWRDGWPERCNRAALARIRRDERSGKAARDRAILTARDGRLQRERYAAQLAAMAHIPAAPPGSLSPLDRASRYLAACSPAVSGQGRSNTAWSVTNIVTRGFALADADALDLLAREYAPRCQPTIPLAELRGMVRRAGRGSKPPWGCMLTEARDSR
jgi:hypothetical protein